MRLLFLLFMAVKAQADEKAVYIGTAAMPVTVIQPTVPFSNREIKTRRVGLRNGMKRSNNTNEKDFERQILGEL
jgi:hypothetical protein